MFSLFSNPEQLIKEDTPNQLILAGFHKMKIWGLISLVLAIITAIATISIGIYWVGGIVVLIYLVLGFWLITSNHAITFDSTHQAVYFSTHHWLLKRTTKVIPFSMIDTIYLDYEERDMTEERIRRKWRIFMVLKNQETATVARQQADYSVDQSPILSKQTAAWEDLATKICMITDKYLIRTPTVPGPAPHTFISVIDQIIQRRLAALPPTDPLSNHSVQLRSHPTGAMEIIVDGVNKYRELDDISDPVIRELIQQAVDEWHNLAGHSITEILMMRRSNE